MGKAINAFIEKQPENDKNVVKLHVLDFNHKDGGYEKTVIKKVQRNPTDKELLEFREVTYLYDPEEKDKPDRVTKGWEIVKEISRPRGEYGGIQPRCVGKVTRDLRTKNDIRE